MAGSTLEPKQILAYSADKGTAKAENCCDRLAILGFLGGAFISVGYLAYIRIVAAMPHELAGLGKLLGAAVFPVGLTEGAALAETVAVAHGKTDVSFGQAVVSGIGCNWLVCMGLWLCYGADTFSGKILGCWFPVMVFVAIGFQHVVANMFVIPAAIWGGGDITWAQFAENMVSVYLGNVLGGAVMVGALYHLAYRD